MPEVGAELDVSACSACSGLPLSLFKNWETAIVCVVLCIQGGRVYGKQRRERLGADFITDLDAQRAEITRD